MIEPLPKGRCDQSDYRGQFVIGGAHGGMFCGHRSSRIKDLPASRLKEHLNPRDTSEVRREITPDPSTARQSFAMCGNRPTGIPCSSAEYVSVDSHLLIL